MSSSLLPHVPLGRLLGLIEAMAETAGPDDVYRLAARLRLSLGELQPLLEAARLLDWAHVELGDYDLTAEGQRVAAGGLDERRACFRERARRLPLLAAILLEVEQHGPVARERVLELLPARVPPAEAQRQLDTAIDWGRWAGLFDYDADDGSFLEAGKPRV